MKQISVKMECLEKSFLSARGLIQVLKGVNVEIFPGEFFVLLGPSGCGKSTLLNLIAGLDKPTRGRMRFGERIVADGEKDICLGPYERDVAMVFQSYALYPHMTIEENVAFPLTNLPDALAPQELKRRVLEAAKILQIEPLLDRKPAELSGGQRQRVAIGRAIVRNPAVFLMDEPLSNLDAQLRMEMRTQMKDLQARLGITTVYVTHDQLEAMTLGHRIGVLNDGVIQQIGTPHEVFHRPANEFVARFLGSPSMNIFKGTLRQTGEQTVFHSDDIALVLSPAVFAQIRDHTAELFSIGIRPEGFAVCSPEEASLTLHPRVTEMIGSEYLAHASLPSGWVTVRTLEEPQNPLHLKVVPDKVHFFDRQGHRIDMC